MRLILARHGETPWSLSGQHTGRTDIELTDHGQQQARDLGNLLSSFMSGPPSLVLSSPMRRALDTAEIAGLAAEIEPNLRELDYGDYEGITTPQIRQTVPGWTTWTGTMPNGETLAEAGERADKVLSRARAALSSGDVVLISHGHFLRVLAARWLELDPSEGGRFALGTATACVLGYEHETPVVVHWNLPSGSVGRPR